MHPRHEAARIRRRRTEQASGEPESISESGPRAEAMHGGTQGETRPERQSTSAAVGEFSRLRNHARTPDRPHAAGPSARVLVHCRPQRAVCRQAGTGARRERTRRADSPRTHRGRHRISRSPDRRQPRPRHRNPGHDRHRWRHASPFDRSSPRRWTPRCHHGLPHSGQPLPLSGFDGTTPLLASTPSSSLRAAPRHARHAAQQSLALLSFAVRAGDVLAACGGLRPFHGRHASRGLAGQPPVVQRRSRPPKALRARRRSPTHPTGNPRSSSTRTSRHDNGFFNSPTAPACSTHTVARAPRLHFNSDRHSFIWLRQGRGSSGIPRQQPR